MSFIHSTATAASNRNEFVCEFIWNFTFALIHPLTSFAFIKNISLNFSRSFFGQANSVQMCGRNVIFSGKACFYLFVKLFLHRKIIFVPLGAYIDFWSIWHAFLHPPRATSVWCTSKYGKHKKSIWLKYWTGAFRPKSRRIWVNRRKKG